VGRRHGHRRRRHRISGVAAVENAKAGEITFIASAKYLPLLSTTGASAVIVSPDVKQSDKPLLSVATPIWPSRRS